MNWELRTSNYNRFAHFHHLLVSILMRLMLGFILWLLVVTPAAMAQSTPKIPPLGSNVLRGQPIQLFDGHSLAGWTMQDGQESTNWVVEDGALFRKSGGGDLYHEHWYRDFELTFQWKLLANGNSGVKYRVNPFGNQMLGCEYQLQDDKGSDYNRQSTGALYDVYEPSKHKLAPKIGEWNDSKIIVCGQRIEHWLNGQRVVTATVGNADWWRRVGESKFKQHPGFGLSREGRIFLQDHGHPVWFRNLVVVPLDCN